MLLYIVVGPWVDLVTHWCAVFSQKVVQCAASAARVWSPRYFGKTLLLIYLHVKAMDLILDCLLLSLHFMLMIGHCRAELVKASFKGLDLVIRCWYHLCIIRAELVEQALFNAAFNGRDLACGQFPGARSCCLPWVMVESMDLRRCLGPIWIARPELSWTTQGLLGLVLGQLVLSLQVTLAHPHETAGRSNAMVVRLLVPAT